MQVSFATFDGVGRRAALDPRANALATVRDGGPRLEIFNVIDERKGRSCRVCKDAHITSHDYAGCDNAFFGSKGWPVGIGDERLPDGDHCVEDRNSPLDSTRMNPVARTSERPASTWHWGDPNRVIRADEPSDGSDPHREHCRSIHAPTPVVFPSRASFRRRCAVIRSLDRLCSLAAAAAVGVCVSIAFGSDLRNVKHGDPVPTVQLPMIDGSIIDTASLRGSAVVIVCLAAEQRRSELAAAESSQVVRAFTSDAVKLLHVAADETQKTYFEGLRRQQGIDALMLFDPDRTLSAQLGLIVFPTTVIIAPSGTLDGVISLHGSDYKALLELNIRHALGQLTDEQLEAKLSLQSTTDEVPKRAASAHRSLARLMREKGMPDAARVELTKSLALDPENIDAQLDLAELNITSGDLASAEAALMRVVAEQPHHVRARAMQGECLFRQGDLDAAKSILEGIVDLSPKPERAHYFLGMIHEQQGHKDAALEHYRRALESLLNDQPAAAPSSEPTQRAE